MATLIIIVLLLLALGLLGAVAKGLLWLTAIVALLLVASLAYGWWKLRGFRRT